MRSTLWWLGLIFGTLSVVMLIKQGFGYGFSAPLQLTLEYYEQTMQVLFGWADPWIEASFAQLGWRIELYSHWRHIFVLMSISTLTSARVYWDWWRRLPGRRVFLVGSGLFCSLLGSVLAGTIALTGRPLESFLIVAYPIIGLTLHRLILGLFFETFTIYPDDRPTNATILGRHLRASITYSGTRLLVVAAAVFFSPLANLRYSGVLLLGLLVLAGAIANLINGIRVTYLDLKGSELPDTWVEIFEYFADNGGRPAIVQLGTFVGAGAFIAANAGLRLAGIE